MGHLRNLILLLTLVSATAVFAVGEVSHPVAGGIEDSHPTVTLTLNVVKEIKPCQQVCCIILSVSAEFNTLVRFF